MVPERVIRSAIDYLTAQTGAEIENYHQTGQSICFPVRSNSLDPSSWIKENADIFPVTTSYALAVNEILEGAEAYGLMPLPLNIEASVRRMNEARENREMRRREHVASSYRIGADYTTIWSITSPLYDFQNSTDKVRQKKTEAQVKALQLLHDVLPADQFELYKTKQYVEVTGTIFKYRIRKSGQTQIRSLTCSCLKATACIQIDGWDPAAYQVTQHPTEDRIVAEYLLLKNDERKYLVTANLTWLDAEDEYRVQNAELFRQALAPPTYDGFTALTFDGGSEIRPYFITNRGF